MKIPLYQGCDTWGRKEVPFLEENQESFGPDCIWPAVCYRRLRKDEMKTSLIILVLVSIVLFPVVVPAAPGKNGKLSAKPYITNHLYEDVLDAAWIPHQGIVDSGKSYHALYFQKDDVTSLDGYAAAKIKPFSDKAATELVELGFDYKTGGHCTLNAPRWVVNIDGTDYSLGCASGVVSVSPDDPNWTRVRFATTEFTTAGIPTTGTINSLKLVFDEGTDLGPGNIYMDNIDVNGRLIRKSGKGGPK